MKKLIFTLILFLLSACGGSERVDPTVEWEKENRSGGIMFLGDSITAFWPPDMMPDGSYNRGISGDTTGGVLNRTWLIIKEQPDEIYLMIGVNNLHGGWGEDGILTDLNQILLEITEELPGTKITVSSILPSHLIQDGIIQDVNERIEILISTFADVEYVYLYDLFVDDGIITNMADGVHPNINGYRLMYDRLFL